MKGITQLQLYMMFTQFLFSTAIGFFAGPIIERAGYMSWVSIVLGWLLGLVLCYSSYRLAMRRPDGFLGEYGKDIIGKWPHAFIMLLAILNNLFLSAFILRELVDFIMLIYLPGTPDWAIAALFGLCVARGIRMGPVNFFRSAQGLFHFSVIAVLAFPIFVRNEVDTDKMIALITDFNPGGIWDGMLLDGALFGEMAFIAYLFPYFNNKSKTFRTLAWSGFTAVVVTVLNTVATMLLFGSDLSANMTYPALEMVRYIRSGSFLENLDPLLIVFWLFSMLLKIGLFLLIGMVMTANFFRLKDYKPLSYGMAAAIVVLSLYMFHSAADIEHITTHSESALLLLKDLLPTLYLIVDSLRSRKPRGVSAAS